MKSTHVALLNILIALIYAGAIVLIDPGDTTRNWIVMAWFVTMTCINIIPATSKK